MSSGLIIVHGIFRREYIPYSATKLGLPTLRRFPSPLKELRSLTWNPDGFRLLLVVLFVAILWIYYQSIRFVSVLIWPVKKPNAAIFFAAFHEKIRKVFKCQREETFSVILMGVDRVMHSGRSGDNSVLLFLTPEGASGTAHTLATLLVHCVLIGYQQSSDHRRVKALLVDGAKYSHDHADWKFFLHLRRNLRRHGVVAVLGAQKLHPRVLNRLVTLCSPNLNTSYMSVIILVMDVKKRFTNHELMTMPTNSLGRIFLEELLTPYQRDNLINLLTARCVLVLPEQTLPIL